MIGLLLGLMGAGAILGGAALGSMSNPPSQHRGSSSGSGSDDYGSGSGSYGGGSSYYGSAPGSYLPTSRQDEEPVYRFDKETGRLETL